MPDNGNVKSHRCERLLNAKQSIRHGYGYKHTKRDDYLGWWVYGWKYDSEYDPIFSCLFKLDFCPFCGEKLEKGAD